MIRNITFGMFGRNVKSDDDIIVFGCFYTVLEKVESRFNHNVYCQEMPGNQLKKKKYTSKLCIGLSHI